MAKPQFHLLFLVNREKFVEALRQRRINLQKLENKLGPHYRYAKKLKGPMVMRSSEVAHAIDFIGFSAMVNCIMCITSATHFTINPDLYQWCPFAGFRKKMEFTWAPKYHGGAKFFSELPNFYGSAKLESSESAQAPKEKESSTPLEFTKSEFLENLRQFIRDEFSLAKSEESNVYVNFFLSIALLLSAGGIGAVIGHFI